MGIALTVERERVSQFVAALRARFDNIEQIHLLCNDIHTEGDVRPDLSLLLYVPLDQALDTMTAIARSEHHLRPLDVTIHLYVEYFGGAMQAVWGGSMISFYEAIGWEEGQDYCLIWKHPDGETSTLAERLLAPTERRQGDRRERLEMPATEQRKVDRRQAVNRSHTDGPD